MKVRAPALSALKEHQRSKVAVNVVKSRSARL